MVLNRVDVALSTSTRGKDGPRDSESGALARENVAHVEARQLAPSEPLEAKYHHHIGPAAFAGVCQSVKLVKGEHLGLSPDSATGRRARLGSDIDLDAPVLHSELEE